LILPPRLVPVSIGVFRYFMICRPVFTHNFGDRRLWRLIQAKVVLVTGGMGYWSYFYKGDSILYLRCMAREETFWFNTDDFYTETIQDQRGYQVVAGLDLMDPMHLTFFVINLSYLLVVPSVYLAIFRFRKTHDNNIRGISESERSQRKENNLLATEVNFTRWLFEVLGTIVFVSAPKLDIGVRVVIWRLLTACLPPLFYILALNADFHRRIKWFIRPRKQSSVYPMVAR